MESSLSLLPLYCGGLECRKAFILLFVLPELGLTCQVEGLTNLSQIIYEKINERMHALEVVLPAIWGRVEFDYLYCLSKG